PLTALSDSAASNLRDALPECGLRKIRVEFCGAAGGGDRFVEVPLFCSFVVFDDRAGQGEVAGYIARMPSRICARPCNLLAKRVLAAAQPPAAGTTDRYGMNVELADFVP